MNICLSTWKVSKEKYRIRYNHKGYRIQRKGLFLWVNCEYHLWDFEIKYYNTLNEAQGRLEKYRKEEH